LRDTSPNEPYYGARQNQPRHKYDTQYFFSSLADDSAPLAVYEESQTKAWNKKNNFRSQRRDCILLQKSARIDRPGPDEITRAVYYTSRWTWFAQPTSNQPPSPEETIMESQEHRMQCLRMAFELGGKPENVLSAAEQLLMFVTGKPQAAPAEATAPAIEAAAAEPAEAPPAPPVEEAAVAAVVADPIAACGTAMQMTDSGDLADATPTAELTVQTADVSSPIEEVVAEAVTIQTQPEATASTAGEPAMEPAAEATAVAAEPEPAIETAAAEEAATPAAEPAAAPDAPEPTPVETATAQDDEHPADETPATVAAHAGETPEANQSATAHWSAKYIRLNKLRQLQIRDHALFAFTDLADKQSAQNIIAFRQNYIPADHHRLISKPH
jgi:hypothetical protein